MQNEPLSLVALSGDATNLLSGAIGLFLEVN
jgi:hypothetical protein